MRDLREQLAGWAKRGRGEVRDEAQRLHDAVLDLEKDFAIPRHQTRLGQT